MFGNALKLRTHYSVSQTLFWRKTKHTNTIHLYTYLDYPEHVCVNKV